MGTKTGILVGICIGYVLGTRAGRERYEQIRVGVAKLRRFPVVARPLDAAGQKMSDIVRAGGEQVTDKVADAVKERLFGGLHPRSPRPCRASSAPRPRPHRPSSTRPRARNPRSSLPTARTVERDEPPGLVAGRENVRRA